MPLDITTIHEHKAKKKKSRNKRFLQGFKQVLDKDIAFLSKIMNDKKKQYFYSELSILLSSGVDIKTALEIITEEQKKEKHKLIFEEIKLNVISGGSLSEAIELTRKFSLYEYHSLRIGEESGRLNDVLVELSRYYANRIKQKRQLTGALTYPSLVLFTAIIAVVFMMNFIVPMFSDVFKRLQGDLPAITRFIISMSESFGRITGIFFIVLSMIVVFVVAFKNKNWYRQVTSCILLRLPYVNTLVKKIYLARYCQSMSLLLTSKTPIIKAIQLVKEMIGFYPYSRSLEKIEKMILRGKNLYEGMEKFTIFDRRIIYLTKVAEEVNQLDIVYDTLNKQYTDELEHHFGILNNILEPALIIFVGTIVAIILISMYMPMFQLSTSVF